MKQLLSAEEIAAGVRRLAGQINQHYGQRPVTIVGVLTGCVVLLADLIRQLEMPLRVGVVQARSYRGSTTSPGRLTISAEMLPDLRGRDVLLLDDIFDTGHTLSELLDALDDLRPHSVRSAVLLRKADRVEVAVRPDWIAFDIPDEFVVGYGLDYNDLYRNLPYVASLEPHELNRGSSP